MPETTAKAFRLAESPKIFPEFLRSAMDRNPVFRQKGLKGELAHLCQTPRLREGRPLLLEQRYANSCFSSARCHEPL